MKLKIPTQLQELEAAISAASGVNVEEIHSRLRDRRIIKARFSVWFVAHDHMGYGLSELGRIYRRDHTTILNACEKMRSKQEDCQHLINQLTLKFPGLIIEKKNIKDWKF